MAAAVPYDEMSEDTTESADDTESESADPADDEVFLMEAEEAGFSGEKAKAFWRAVARCVELTQGGASPMMEEEESEA